MKKLKEVIVKHKRTSMLVLFALIVFTGFSVTNAVSVAGRRAEEDAKEAMTEEQLGEAEDEDGGEDAQLSDSQKGLVENYDSATIRLVETLGSSVWSAQSGKYTLRFHDTWYTETVSGKETVHPYAISACEFDNNGSDMEIDRIVFETDEGTHIATYTLAKSGENAGAGTITSATMFSLKDTAYERTEPVAKIDVSDLNDEITELLGDNDTFVNELSNWCAVHYPSAVKAVWSKSATIDYDKGLVVTSFALSDDANANQITGSGTSLVTVTYDRAAQTYSFSM